MLGDIVPPFCIFSTPLLGLYIAAFIYKGQAWFTNDILYTHSFIYRPLITMWLLKLLWTEDNKIFTYTILT